MGTGAYVKPSTITIPAATSEHMLNAGGVSALTLCGFNYVSNKRFAGLTFGWANNLLDRSSYFPGSGTQSGFQLRGRMRRGVPAITLSATVECDTGSSEEDYLIAGTEGTGIVTIDGDNIGEGPSKHQLKLTFHKLKMEASKMGESEGIATYNVVYSVMEHSTNGVLTVEATCEQNNILVAAS